MKLTFIATALALLTSAPSSAAELLFADEFESGDSLAQWQSFEPSNGWPDHLRRASVVDGALELEPWTSGWYAEFHAPFLFREIEGDFFASTRLRVDGKKGGLPQSAWSLAGLMLREPRRVAPDAWEPRAENWLFVTTGVAENTQQPVFETKTTVNSRSNLKLRPAPTGWVELGIARIGPNFLIMVREEDKPWRILERFYRSDLPARLQVGIAAYTDWNSAGELQKDPHAFNTTVLRDGKPDLVARVDWLRARRIDLPRDVNPWFLSDYGVDEKTLLELVAP